jgi:hypothetical protein
VTRRSGGVIRTGVADGHGIRWTGAVPELSAEVLAVLRSGGVFSDLEAALKLFVPVSVQSDRATTTVVSRCVAVPNFGNRYGETRSVIADGRVISEDSRI